MRGGNVEVFLGPVHIDRRVTTSGFLRFTTWVKVEKYSSSEGEMERWPEGWRRAKAQMR